MADPDQIENQLQKMMEAVLLSFLEVNQTDPANLSAEGLRKKAQDIICLSRDLDQAIDQCPGLAFSNEGFSPELEALFEEKRQKAQELGLLCHQAGSLVHFSGF